MSINHDTKHTVIELDYDIKWTMVRNGQCQQNYHGTIWPMVRNGQFKKLIMVRNGP